MEEDENNQDEQRIIDEDENDGNQVEIEDLFDVNDPPRRWLFLPAPAYEGEDEEFLRSDSESELISNPSTSSTQTVSDNSEIAEEMGTHHSKRKMSSIVRQQNFSFDRQLPATHSYLGADLEDAGGGSTFLEAEAVVDGVPMLAVPGVILMPGQTLPLQHLTLRYFSMFQNIITHHKLFAVVTMREKRNERRMELASIGTLAQVKEYKEESEHELTSYKAKAVGTQRFELLEKSRTLDGTQVCKVRILPEYTQFDPLRCFELGSMQKFKLFPHGRSSKEFRRPGTSKYGKYFASHFTPMPWFVYKQWDIVRTMK